MKLINNYIVEKLHLNKDTKPSDAYDVCIELCDIENDKRGQKAIKELLDKIGDGIKSINDLYIFTIKPYFNAIVYNSHKKYVTIDEELVDNIDKKYKKREYWTDNPYPYRSSHEIYEIYDKSDNTCGFILYLDTGDLQYNIYFMNKQLV